MTIQNGPNVAGQIGLCRIAVIYFHSLKKQLENVVYLIDQGKVDGR